MRRLNYGLMVAAAVGFALLMLPLGGVCGVLFFGLFGLWPLMIQGWLIYRFDAEAVQVVLAVTTLLYVAWAVFIYVYVTQWCNDPQCPIVFVFTGIYALPGLLPMWGLAVGLEARARRSKS